MGPAVSLASPASVLPLPLLQGLLQKAPAALPPGCDFGQTLCFCEEAVQAEMRRRVAQVGRLWGTCLGAELFLGQSQELPSMGQCRVHGRRPLNTRTLGPPLHRPSWGWGLAAAAATRSATI